MDNFNTLDQTSCQIFWHKCKLKMLHYGFGAQTQSTCCHRIKHRITLNLIITCLLSFFVAGFGDGSGGASSITFTGFLLCKQSIKGVLIYFQYYHACYSTVTVERICNYKLLDIHISCHLAHVQIKPLMTYRVSPNLNR